MRRDLRQRQFERGTSDCLPDDQEPYACQDLFTVSPNLPSSSEKKITQYRRQKATHRRSQVLFHPLGEQRWMIVVTRDASW
jgi:hypothetical protein